MLQSRHWRFHQLLYDTTMLETGVERHWGVDAGPGMSPVVLVRESVRSMRKSACLGSRIGFRASEGIRLGSARIRRRQCANSGGVAPVLESTLLVRKSAFLAPESVSNPAATLPVSMGLSLIDRVHVSSCRIPFPVAISPHSGGKEQFPM